MTVFRSYKLRKRFSPWLLAAGMAMPFANLTLTVHAGDEKPAAASASQEEENEQLRQRLEQAESELRAIRKQIDNGKPDATKKVQAPVKPASFEEGAPLLLTQEREPSVLVAPQDGASMEPPADGIPADPPADGAPSPGETEMSPDFGGLTPEQDLPTPSFNMPASPLKLPVSAQFGTGFELKSKDDEFSLQFHDLTQFDYRFYEQRNQATVRNTFAFPRQWFIFNGRLTKPIEYYVSIAEGFDTLNILDVFVNFHYSDKLQFRVGRYKTPFTYEFYALPINGLINPERSLFFNNFGLNRDLGAMAWGLLADKRIDYALGVFNGTRNGFLDANDGKDFLGYVNFKPFVNSDAECLQFFNVGGSMMYGDQNNAPIPRTLRTVVPTTGSDAIGIPFLTFNDNVRESGERQFFSLHSAYYHKHLSVVGEWESGYQSYNFTGSTTSSTQLPVQSGYLQAGYFLTGETVSGRGMVKPIRPFDIRKGKFGCGAWEPFARYNYLHIGRDIFNLGFSNPDLYANQLYTTDVGFNWYLTQYFKFVFQWEHAEFDQPVAFRPGARQINADMFLCRCQLFF
ncbi:MAG: porin [Planctomycetota bacterium]